VRARSVGLSACGLIGGLLIWLALARMVPANAAAPTVADRMAVGAAALLPAAAALAAMTVVQIVTRFATGTFDPTAGRDGRLLIVNQRVIANTVEQMLCFVPTVLALSAAVAPARMPLVVAGALTFALARLVFWAGYLAAPLLRAPGMAATGAANLVTLVCAVWAWLG